MMHIHTLPLGVYQTNCYLVWGDGADSCVVIDPGFTPEVVMQEAANLHKTIEAVFLTHGHFDHVGGVEAIVKATGCALWMHEGDWSQKKNLITARLYPLANCAFCNVNFYEHMETVTAAGLTFTVYETPGHTYGSVCLAVEDALFTGDTLFAGSCGRTDLAGGSWNTIMESLHWLSQLEQDAAVYPGHGEASTLAREKQYNPYLK